MLITGFETIKQTLQKIEAHHSMKEIKVSLWKIPYFVQLVFCLNVRFPKLIALFLCSEHQKGLKTFPGLNVDKN